MTKKLPPSKNPLPLLMRVRKLKADGDPIKVVELLRSFEKKDYAKDPEVSLELGDCLMTLERFSEATEVYAALAEAYPRSALVFSNLGAALYRCRRTQEARTVLEHALLLDPKSMSVRTNLGGVLQSTNDFDAALRNALELVANHPTEALAFNNLGSAFSDLNNIEAARHAFETAVMLKPGQIDALTNLAVMETRFGNFGRAIELFQQAIEQLPSTAIERRRALEFYKGFEHLRLGQLDQGWALYESGFSKLVPINAMRSPDREFGSKPRWQGEDLSDKTLLIWREQGIGDEIRFAACIDDLKGKVGRIIFECSPRLAPLFSKAWDFVETRPETPYRGEGIPTDFDYHLPIGSLMYFFRRDISDFSRSRPYAVPESGKVAKFLGRLAGYRQGKKLVGICWRSGLLTPTRNSEYTHLLDWGSVLSRGDVVFVNLQYGESSQELADAREKLGVEILNWPDLDLKQHVEDVLALISCLDLVVTVRTTVNNMAGVVGTKCALLIKETHWSLLGQKTYPWFPNNETLLVPEADSVASHLDRVHAVIDRL